VRCARRSGPSSPIKRGDIVNQIRSEPEQRSRRLLEQLEMDCKEDLTAAEAQLVALLTAYTDAFSLDSAPQQSPSTQ
jgi:hypothetical protein